MKIFKFTSKNNKINLKFQNTRNFPTLDYLLKMLYYKNCIYLSNSFKESPKINETISDRIRDRESKNPLNEAKILFNQATKVLKLKEIYKMKTDRKKIVELVKKKLFEDKNNLTHASNVLNDNLSQAEEIEKEKIKLAKIQEIKEILIELIEDFSLQSFKMVIQEIHSKKLYYYDIIVNLEKLYNDHHIFLDMGSSEITREVIVYGVHNKIIRFKEQTFLKIINNHMMNTKKLTFSQINHFLISFKKVENYISSSNINELYSVRLMNHIKKSINEGNVIIESLNDLYAFSYTIRNRRDVFDYYIPVNEKLWRNFNYIISENGTNMDIDSTVLAASLITFYKDIYQNRVYIGLHSSIEVVNNYIINFFINYEFLPLVTKEKLGLMIPSILHYYLNFIRPSNSTSKEIVLERILEIYSKNFETPNVILTKVDVENFYILGTNEAPIEQEFYEKIAQLLTLNKITFPNEVIEKVGSEETNPLIFNIGKFLHGFSQNKIVNFEFWNKMINKMKDLNINFPKKGSELNYIYYFIFNIFKENNMKLIMEMFVNSIFNKQFEDIYKSSELIELFATFPREKNEFIEKTILVLNNYEKMLKNQRNERILNNFINIITILASFKKELFSNEVCNLIAKGLISSIRSSNLSINEITSVLKLFNEIKNSLYMFNQERLNEELVKELFCYLSNSHYSEDFKKVIKPMYYCELVDNLSLVKLNYFLELNGLIDKRELVLKMFPMINYERNTYSVENIHNI